MMHKILLDAGHGINTKGKSSPNCALKEWRYNPQIAAAVAARLHCRGYDAELVTPEDTDIPLKERVERINRIAMQNGIANTFVISIHVNAAGKGDKWMDARGWSAYTYPGHTESDDIADCLYFAAEEHLPGHKIRTDFSDEDPDFESPFYILKHTLCSAVLVENLFMDNREDCAFLLSSEGRSAIIGLLVDGIIDYVDQHEGDSFR